MADVLLYTHGPRALASALIGHVYEIAQQHSVVVVTDPLPPRYRALLERRDLFPGLKQVVELDALGFSLRELMSGNRRWLSQIRRLLDAHTPNIVVGENDMSSLFDMYLMSEAKRRGIPRLTIQSMGQVVDADNRRFAELAHVYGPGDDPGALLRGWRLLRCRARKAVGHLFVHYVLPWLAGRRALPGRSSYIHFTGAPGMRDTSLHLVQSEPQRRVCIASGVPPARLAILSHPAGRVPSELFVGDDTHLGSDRRTVLALLAPVSSGVRAGTGAVIPVGERRAARMAALNEIVDAMPGWRVVLKAHPLMGTRDDVGAYLGDAAAQVSIADPAQPVEWLLSSADVVLDLPPGSTSALVTAAALFPNRPAISVNLDDDALGSVYNEWSGIIVVRDRDQLRDLLRQIAAGTYEGRRQPSAVPPAGTPEFETTTDAIAHVLGRVPMRT